MWKPAISSAALVICVSWAASVGASTVTVYTDKVAWENALSGQFLTEDFADSELNDGISFVSSESGHINPAEQCYQDVLASTSQNEPMTTWTFAPRIFGYGGNWTLGGPGGSGNSLLVYIADSSLHVGTISNSYGGEFWGFISDTFFTSVKLVGGLGSHQQNYRLDDMVYSDVPEPMLPGDYNDNGIVDEGDYTVWLTSFGGSPAWMPNDASPGTVDATDYTVWRDNFGETLGSGSVASAIPEPSSVVLLLAGVMCLALRRTGA